MTKRRPMQLATLALLVAGLNASPLQKVPQAVQSANPCATPQSADPCAKYYGCGYCTDYIQERVGSKPSGDANTWPGNTCISSIRVGDAAIFSVGCSGHVAYVEEVILDKATGNPAQIRISEKNWGPVLAGAQNQQCVITSNFGKVDTRTVPVSTVAKVWRPNASSTPSLSLAKKPADFRGWENVEWGMTDEQIQKLYPEAQPFKPGDKTLSRLKIQTFQLVNRQFEVYFARDTDKRLVYIDLSRSDSASKAVFTEVEKHLTAKYGEPISKDDKSFRDGEPFPSRKWVFPSTEIGLWMFRDRVGIHYSPADKNRSCDLEGDPAKRTMQILRSIGMACESYAVDNKHYPLATSLDELVRLVAPTYIKVCPAQDGWGHPIEYLVAKDGQDYRIISAGCDGVIEAASRVVLGPVGGETSSDAADIIFEDGQFRQYPRRLQP